jgi:hypothetical protein
MSTTSTPPRTDITVPVIEGVEPELVYLLSRTEQVLRLAERVGVEPMEFHYPDGANGCEREHWMLSLWWTEDGVRCRAHGPRTYAPTLQQEQPA